MFFWQHLEHDIHMLSIALGKSKDDACLLMHLVLKNIATFDAAMRKYTTSQLSLGHNS